MDRGAWRATVHGVEKSQRGLSTAQLSTICINHLFIYIYRDTSCLFDLYTEYIMRNTGLDEAQAGIKIGRRNIDNLRYADDTTFMAESEEELKSLFMKVKEESEKIDLKLNIQKTKIMASGPVISWQIDGETEETVADFIFLGFKITTDGDCSMKLKDTYSLEGKL